MNQVSRNAKHRLNKGLVAFSALVKPEAKELFSEIRKHNHITTAELFEQMLDAYQRQDKESIIILQPEGIDINMTVPDRKAFALELLKLHKRDKKKVMLELKERLQTQYPGFRVNKEVEYTGVLADAMRFYSAVSDHLGRYIKSGQRP